MKLEEKKLNSRYIFHGKILNVRVDEVELPNGRTSTREVVEHPGGVGILALTDDKQVYMVRQYRYPVNRVLLEIPAGKMDKAGEDHLQTGIRELYEETGLTADHMTYLGQVFASVGFMDEVIHLYLATGLHEGEQHLDEDEFVNVEKIPFAELERMVQTGDMVDGKTIAALYKTKLLLHL